jgi:hypothetical protein
MNEKSQPQYLIWIIVTILALVGTCVIGFLISCLWNGNCFSPATSTIVSPQSSGESTPAPTSTPIVTIFAIKSKAELATVEYNTIVEINRENAGEGLLDEFFGTKEHLLMLVYGNIKAGFDLEKMTDKNLWTDGKRARLVLPAPQILNSSIDFNRTHIVSYESNKIIDKNDPDFQRKVLAEATDAIEQSALENGVLTKANEYGKLYFENFLYSLGFTDVEVVVDAQIYKE